MRPRFHLAFPVHDLHATRRFYGGLLGAREARSAERWVDFDFWGHQISAHLVDEADAIATNPVDGEDVPARHFGVILPWDEWHTLRDRLVGSGQAFRIAPQIRFLGEPGEQATMFVDDPSGNSLEFKAFRDERGAVPGPPFHFAFPQIRSSASGERRPASRFGFVGYVEVAAAGAFLLGVPLGAETGVGEAGLVRNEMGVDAVNLADGTVRNKLPRGNELRVQPVGQREHDVQVFAVSLVNELSKILGTHAGRLLGKHMAAALQNLIDGGGCSLGFHGHDRHGGLVFGQHEFGIGMHGLELGAEGFAGGFGPTIVGIGHHHGTTGLGIPHGIEVGADVGTGAVGDEGDGDLLGHMPVRDSSQ